MGGRFPWCCTFACDDMLCIDQGEFLGLFFLQDIQMDGGTRFSTMDGVREEI